jgi:hypothetical protein
MKGNGGESGNQVEPWKKKEVQGTGVHVTSVLIQVDKLLLLLMITLFK